MSKHNKHRDDRPSKKFDHRGWEDFSQKTKMEGTLDELIKSSDVSSVVPDLDAHELLATAVMESNVDPGAITQVELHSSVRLSTADCRVLEKSLDSRFEKISDADIDKIVSEQKNENTTGTTEKWLRVFDDFSRGQQPYMRPGDSFGNRSG